MEGWAIFLIALAAWAGLFLLCCLLLQRWAKSTYDVLLKSPPTHCDIDTFVGMPEGRNVAKTLKVVAAHKFRLGNREPSLEPIPLECYPSPHVDGLLVSQKAGTSSSSGDATAMSLGEVLSGGDDKKKKGGDPPAVVIATIRMGFGHHRLAYSAASWSIGMGYRTIFHDLLNIQSDEADLIKSTDELYSKMSRYASELGGPVEAFWGNMMLAGDADALRIAYLTAVHLQPLLLSYPKNIPIITTHQLVALTASAIGFSNVVNLVVDNHPQWFLTVPNTHNIVQGPVNYMSFLKMGIRQDELEWTGHWCPEDMVNNIDADCSRRIARVEARKVASDSENGNNRPLRLLIPVGGAGAQKKFIIQLVRETSNLVKSGKVQLFLNAGDHEHMKTAFLQVLDECGLDFDTVDTTEGVRSFQGRLLENDGANEPNKSVTLFAFDEYFPAVATTDILCRVADVLACKPSELAFYCVPKLHIRRVGNHEADSAKRSSELNDGTVEAREVPDAMNFIDLFLNSPDLLEGMNRAIMRNHTVGVYNGCQRAVQIVTERYDGKAADAAPATTTDTSTGKDDSHSSDKKKSEATTETVMA